MVIDIHVHYSNRPEFLEELLSTCLDVEVDKVCLNGGGPEWNQYGNDEVQAAFQKHPDQIIGFGFIKLGIDPPELVDDLYQRGFKGLKTQNPLSYYDDERFFAFYEKAEKYRLPILFHTGIGAPYQQAQFNRQFKTSSDYMRPVCLDKIARSFPDLNLIAAHLGFPWCAEAAFMAIMLPNFYYDLAGIDRTETMYPSQTPFKDLLGWHPAGFGKMLFGTEGASKNLAWVKTDYEQLLARHQIPPETVRAVMGDTARRLIGL